MIKALIVDDDPNARKGIADLIQTFFHKEINIVHQSGSVDTGLDAIQKYEPDLLFLDIGLDGNRTAFDLINLSEYKNFDVIFFTAHNDKAIKAIRIGALDYLLKPVDEDEFKEAVQKAIKNRNTEDNHLEKLIEISSEYLRGVEKKRVILKTLETVYAIYEDDIIYCKSDGNYTTFHTLQNEKITVSKPVKYYEEILSSKDFVRSHKSYVVNTKQVLRYNHKKGVLITGLDYEVPVSIKKKEYVLKRIFG